MYVCMYEEGTGKGLIVIPRYLLKKNGKKMEKLKRLIHPNDRTVQTRTEQKAIFCALRRGDR